MRTASCAAGATLVLAIAAWGCGGAIPKAPEFENMAADVDYVGRDSCRPCHVEKFSTYVKTGMGRSLYPLAQAEIVEDWNSEFTVEPAGLHYRMERRDGKFYQKQFVVDSAGREIVKEEHELVYVIGSNHHSRSYVVLMDDKLFQAPACWYPQGRRWDLCPGYEFKNEHFHRELGLDCLHCHNGFMEPVAGERNQFVTPFSHGIGCERCHGPGQLHVARWQSRSETGRGDRDPTIVNPGRLPQEERIEVCFQCHLGDAKTTENVLRPGREPRGFRPGMKITEVVMPFHYKEQTRFDFGLSSQADRLILSRCYKESGGRIECLTCHDPHVTVYQKDRPDDHFRLACLSCHAVEDCAAPPAARQATTPADDCVYCHMRKAEPDDQRYTEFTDHWIRRDNRVVERDERESYELEPIFPDRAAALPPGELAFYRGRAGFLLARDAPESKRQEVWAQAERDFVLAIEQGFDNVDSWFFLGKTRLDMGRSNAAREAFAKAVERDPKHDDAVFALGQALVAKGETARALELFLGILERDPDSTMALAEIGRVYTALGRIPEAIAAYERALREEPWTSSLHLNLGMLLASQSRFDEAAVRGEAAVRLDPDNPGVWEFYAKVLRAAGRHAEADEGQLVLARLKQ